MKIVFGGIALYFGSVRILEHRGGHWSDPMKSFSAKSSRTLSPLIRGCERHVDCVQPFCRSSVMGSSSLWMFVFVFVYDLYTAYYDLHFYKFWLI